MTNQVSNRTWFLPNKLCNLFSAGFSYFGWNLFHEIGPEVEKNLRFRPESLLFILFGRRKLLAETLKGFKTIKNVQIENQNWKSYATIIGWECFLTLKAELKDVSKRSASVSEDMISFFLTTAQFITFFHKIQNKVHLSNKSLDKKLNFQNFWLIFVVFVWWKAR